MKYVPFAIALLGTILVIVLQFFPLGGPSNVDVDLLPSVKQSLAQEVALELELENLNSAIATANSQNGSRQQLEQQKRQVEDALAKLREEKTNANVENDPTNLATKPDNTTHVMQIGISVLVLASGLWVILSKKYQPAIMHWAYGAVGTIIGFWLKG